MPKSGATKCGHGRRCNLKVINAAGRGRSSPLCPRYTSTATERGDLQEALGQDYPALTAIAAPSVTSGKPMPGSFPKRSTEVLAKRPVKQHTWSAGTIPCVSGSDEWCGKRSRSLRIQSGTCAPEGMTALSTALSSPIIRAYQLMFSHYQNANKELMNKDSETPNIDANYS